MEEGKGTPRSAKEETRDTCLIPGPKRASITEHGSLNPTLKEGAYHMKRLTLIALAVVLALAISVWTSAPAAAQTPIQRGRTFDLLFYSTAGTTALSFGATYPFSFILDGTLNYVSAGGTSTTSLGARYWFPARPAGLAPYVGAGVTFSTGATGFFIGGGATTRLAPPVEGERRDQPDFVRRHQHHSL